MSSKTIIPAPSLPLMIAREQFHAGNPRRPPHPLELKAFDSQIHLLFQAWIQYTHTLPMTPQVGACELYKQMDARVAILGVITYAFNRLIAEFSLAYGPDHPILAETSRKDITAYSKCSEGEISKLCLLWNSYTEAFQAKFRETRGYPKQAANLMKEELSRLLYISKAMEKIWLDGRTKGSGTNGKTSEKEEGIKRWIASTAAHLSSLDYSRGPEDDTSMQKGLAENKLTAVRVGTDLAERLERRKHAILHTNYVEEMWKVKRSSESRPGNGSFPTLNSEGLRNDSMWGEGAEEKRKSESSYEEFNIEDMRYLRPMFFNRPPTPMPLWPSRLVNLRPPSPAEISSDSARLPSDYPPSPSLPSQYSEPPSSSKPQRIHLQTSISQSEKISQYPDSALSSSTMSSSALLASSSEHKGFSFRSVFSTRSRATSISITTDPTISHLANSAITLATLPMSVQPTLKHAQELSKPRSMASLRSPPPPMSAAEIPPPIPCRNSSRTPTFSEGDGQPKTAIAEYEHIGNDYPLELTNSKRSSQSRTGRTLRGKCSQYFGGRRVKEVVNGEEDLSPEQRAYRSEPY